MPGLSVAFSFRSARIRLQYHEAVRSDEGVSEEVAAERNDAAVSDVALSLMHAHPVEAEAFAPLSARTDGGRPSGSWPTFARLKLIPGSTGRGSAAASTPGVKTCTPGTVVFESAATAISSGASLLVPSSEVSVFVAAQLELGLSTARLEAGDHVVVAAPLST